jgi:RHS repeat-associated protein
VPADTHSYGYDLLNRLTTVDTASYGYDNADNLTQLLSGGTQSFDAANQLANTGYQYDSRGNRTAAPQAGTVGVSGNEITDAVRSAGVQGDGRAAPDSSFGIWWAATNLVLNGGFETNTTGWSAAGSATLARDTTAHQFGVASLKIQTAASAGSGTTGAAVTVNASAPYTFSTWVNAPSGTTIQLKLQDNATIPASATATIAGNGAWQRASVTLTTSAGATRVTPSITQTTTASVAVRVDGAQIESGTGPTPYVQTNGATVRRSPADVTVPAGGLTPTQGWVAVRVRPGWAASSPTTGAFTTVFSWRDSSSDQITLYYRKDGAQWWAARVGGGTTRDVASATQTFAAGTAHTLIIAWDATRVALSVDGSPFSANTGTPAIPSWLPPRYELGDVNDAFNWLNGDVLWAAQGAGTLTNADATTINSVGSTDPTLAQLPSSPVRTWAADTTADQGQASYTYDQANRLTHAVTPAGTGTYTYNGDGLRMATTTGNGDTRHFAWDQTTSVPLMLTDGATSYVYGPGDLPIEQINGATPVWYHHDQLGSTRLLTDTNGTTVSTFTYDPYGNLSGTTGNATTPLGYAGQYTDPETGLTYMRARYYDPTTAQWLTRDPQVALTREAYGYVGGNPLNVTDPDGMNWLSDRASDVGGAIARGAARGWNDSGGKAVAWVNDNPGAAVTLLAAGTCVVGNVEGCAYATITAFGARTAQNVVEHKPVSVIATDAFATYATFSLATLPGYAGLGKLSGVLAAGEAGVMDSAKLWEQLLARGLLALPDMAGFLGGLLACR